MQSIESKRLAPAPAPLGRAGRLDPCGLPRAAVSHLSSASPKRFVVGMLCAVQAAVLPWSIGAWAQGASSATVIAEKSQAAMFYAGDDMKAAVHMRLVTKDGKERIRDLTMLRKDARDSGDQKYFIYFRQPADVRDLTFMVWKYAGKDDDRWLYMPALKLVRRIAANDKSSSFVGSDFTYEDVSGRDIVDDVHTLVKEETLGGRTCDVVKAAPRSDKGSDFGHKLSWFDRQNHLPLKEEYYDRRGNLLRVFTADEIRETGGFPTIVKRSMVNVQTGHKTLVTYSDVRYNIGLADEAFTERSLRNAPAEAK